MLINYQTYFIKEEFANFVLLNILNSNQMKNFIKVHDHKGGEFYVNMSLAAYFRKGDEGSYISFLAPMIQESNQHVSSSLCQKFVSESPEELLQKMNEE